MYLKDYAVRVNKKDDTIAKYIKRHPELFEKHVRKRNGKIWLDRKAQSILDNLYGKEMTYDELESYTIQLVNIHDRLTEELATTVNYIKQDLTPKYNQLMLEKKELQQKIKEQEETINLLKRQKSHMQFKLEDEQYDHNQLKRYYKQLEDENRALKSKLEKLENQSIFDILRKK